MKKTISIILLIFVIMLSSCKPKDSGINIPDVNKNPDVSSTIDEFDTADVQIIYTKDERFLIKVLPTNIIHKDNERYLVFKFTVRNNKEIEYKRFQITLLINKELDYILSSGSIAVPFSAFFLTYEGSETNIEGAAQGMNVECEKLIRSDSFFKDYGLSFDDIYELGKNYTILLNWGDGEEKIDISIPVVRG